MIDVLHKYYQYHEFMQQSNDDNVIMDSCYTKPCVMFKRNYRDRLLCKNNTQLSKLTKSLTMIIINPLQYLRFWIKYIAFIILIMKKSSKRLVKNSINYSRQLMRIKLFTTTDMLTCMMSKLKILDITLLSRKYIHH